MKPAEERLNKLLHSGFGAATLAVLALMSLLVSADLVRPFPSLGNHGIALPSPNLWLPARLDFLSDFIAVGSQLTVAALLVMMNHVYKISRSSSMTFASMFLVLQAMTPSLATQVQSGPFTGLVMMVCVMLMLSCYNAPRSVNNIFLCFTAVSAGALCQEAFVPYTLAMLIALVQMRIFRLKPLLAAVLGIIAPWWALWCLGLIPELHLDWRFSTGFFSSMPRWQLIHLIIAASVTIATGAGLTMLNLLRIINSNSRSRAYNGVLIVLAVFSTILLIADYDNCAAYLTMLNILAAFQIGHFLRIYDGKRVCNIVMLTILGIALILYFWELWI